MNKKRFKYEYGWIWNENGEKFDVNECEGQRLVCDKLNEQQATIKKLEEENRELRQSVEYWQKKYEEGTETFQIN